jgi:DNA-directed RNA polymerase specialized sigma24 family protein
MAVETRLLDGYDPSVARLRTWLRACVDRFVQKSARDAARLKRGGGAVHLPLDFAGAEAELGAVGTLPVEEAFEREWLRSLFSMAVEALEADCRARGRELDFRLFELYDLCDDDDNGITYADLAARLDIELTTVTNRLASVRRRFRGIVLETLRGVTGSDEEYQREARDLLGRPPE